MVKASIGVSKIHGFGLIARQSIKAGTLISKYQEGFDRLIPRKEYDALPESAREYLEVYSYSPAMTTGSPIIPIHPTRGATTTP